MTDTMDRKYKKIKEMAERVGFESARYIETKEFCGAPWPSKVLKGMEWNS